MSKKMFYANDNLAIPEYELGRPDCYPTPLEDDLLFYIQRNNNTNTVVYTINRLKNHDINLSEPIKVFWIRFEDGDERRELNYIQKEIAYGYKSEVINNELIKFQFVSHKKYFYLVKKENRYTVVTYFDEQPFELEYAYVHVENFGAFPTVCAIDLSCICMSTKQKTTKRLEF